MNLLLAIDTSQGTSVALLSNGRLLAEISEPSTMLHAEQIGPILKEVLNRSGHRPADVTAVAVGEGPAPFTGLRVGIAAAKFFAKGSGAKLLGVSSLDAIAFGLNLETDTLLVTDARRGEVYFALYRGKSPSGVPIRIQGPGVEKLSDVQDRFDREGTKYQLVNGVVSPESVGSLANALIMEGRATETVGANYLRAPDAVPSRGKKVSG